MLCCVMFMLCYICYITCNVMLRYITVRFVFVTLYNMLCCVMFILRYRTCTVYVMCHVI